MTPRTFSKRLETLGFIRLSIANEINSPAWERSTATGTESIHLRNSMGTAYVIHMGHNCRPRADIGIIGEQWFNYVDPEEKGKTLEIAWNWLLDVGLAFLASPHSRPLHEWQTIEGILVKSNGEGIDIPRRRRLP